MKNIILTDTKEAILSGVNRYLRDKDACMEVHQMPTPRGNREVVFGVNWAACGTKLPEEARRFAENLTEVANICEVLNSYHWKEKFGSDYESEEEYAADVASVIAGLNGGIDFKELVSTII